MHHNYYLLALKKVPLNSPALLFPCRHFSTAFPLSQKQQQPVFDSNESTKQFPVLDILPYGITKKEERLAYKYEMISPRYRRMAINQDWGSVWPAARTFHPATVPLPLYMSYSDPESKPLVGKFNNPELLKIPNFLHLTPPVVKRQCEALKKFCTSWPKGLETDEDCDRHFPIQLTTRDFVFSGPSIRWPDYRIVEMSLKLSDLKLNHHGKDKLKRLLQHRYDPQTDLITISAESCPLRKQNYDYAHYLLTALYFESWKTESWESEKEYNDWEKYYWDKSESRKSISDYYKKVHPSKYSNEDQVLENECVKNYAKAVTELCSEKESPLHLNNYKESVLKILF